MTEERTAAFAEAFRRVYEERWSAIYTYVLGMTSDSDLASDVGQEAFVRLFARGSLPGDPDGWLVSVVNNLLRDGGRTRRRRRGLLERHRYEVPRAAEPERPDAGAARREEKDGVHRALERLPAKQRAVLLLRANGMRYREIAAALDMPVTSVGTTLARALSSFQQVYREGDHASE